MRIGFEARLSDGRSVVEHEGEWTIEPGKRKPWVRLTEFCVEEGLTVEEVALRIDGHRIRLGAAGVAPLRYSLQYQCVVDDLLAEGKQKEYVDLAAHFDGFIIHYVQEASSDEGFVCVSPEHARLALTPLREE